MIYNGGIHSKIIEKNYNNRRSRFCFLRQYDVCRRSVIHNEKIQMKIFALTVMIGIISLKVFGQVDLVSELKTNYSTYRYGFEEDFNYDKLKETVILVLEEKIGAGASTGPSKKN